MRSTLTDGLRGNAFWVHEPEPATGKVTRFATPLFLALVLAWVWGSESIAQWLTE